MKTIELFLNDCSAIYLHDDGCFFFFADDGPGMVRLVVQPRESNYAYSHGGAKYREAMEIIAKYEEDQSF